VWNYRGQTRPPFAEAADPGCESVWDYPRPPRLSTDSRHVIVKTGEQVLADSCRALRVLETASPPTFYLPADDVNVEFLAPAAGRSICEWKGAAQYWSLNGASSQDVIASSYARPSVDYAALAGHFSFYPARVACFIDGERVRPQPGIFYGGWVTDEISGPFKGELGTEHW